MPPDLRVGLCPLPADPIWLQIEEAIYRRARHLSLELVPVHCDESRVSPSRQGRAVQVEELLALELDALIGWAWREGSGSPVRRRV